jgi:hypothetical protein
MDCKQDAGIKRAPCMGERAPLKSENGGLIMEELFTYYDIFATKGVEYLIIIAFFILIVVFWGLLNMRSH